MYALLGGLITLLRVFVVCLSQAVHNPDTIYHVWMFEHCNHICLAHIRDRLSRIQCHLQYHNAASLGYSLERNH
jgi:hypothetical protein